MINDIRGCSGKVLKKLLIGSGAFLVIVILAAYLFVHFYFQRTFSTQLTGMVIRCSEGIQVKLPGGGWGQLKPAQRLPEGTTIRMPDGSQSFLSFDGIRLLTNNTTEIEITGPRSFSLMSGKVAVAAAKALRALHLTLGASSLTTTDSVLNVACVGDNFSVECVSGDATLNEGRDSQYRLAVGQAATISDEEVDLAPAQPQNEFARLESSALERARERFNRVISKYAYQRPNGIDQGLMTRTRLDSTGLRFASYVHGNVLRLAQAAPARSITDYYESLFAPGSRTISIGKQKLIPLEKFHRGAFPIWSHDGSMIAFIESSAFDWRARVRVARVDDLDNPWDISQEYEDVLPFFPVAWAPDNKHVLFMVADHMDFDKNGGWEWMGPYHIKIAPLDPAEGPVREFYSPFTDIPLSLPVRIGKTISPTILKLPWGDAMFCANWGNLAYIPIGDDGQSLANAPGIFLTNFNPREFFILGGFCSPSGGMIVFAGIENFDFSRFNCYVLYDVEDILDGFSEPPRSPKDPRLKRLAPSRNMQIPGNFSFDESLAFFQEDVNGAWDIMIPTRLHNCDFDLFYADARNNQVSSYSQIHLPGSQIFLQLSPEGNRLVMSNYDHPNYQLRVVSFDIEADMDMDLGGVLIDNSGTNLIVPPGALEKNFKVKMSTPFSIKEEAEIPTGESHFFAMRLVDAEGLEKPKFIEPMTLTIRYTDDEVAGLDEGMLDIYYYDESDSANPKWIAMGGTADPEHNEITVEVRHFSKYSIGQHE